LPAPFQSLLQLQFFFGRPVINSFLQRIQFISFEYNYAQATVGTWAQH
jgi:hypothetical protein